MKDKLIYILSFGAAFVLVTGGIIFLNTLFSNIFAFDFSPANTPVKKEQLKKEKPKETKEQIEKPALPPPLLISQLYEKQQKDSVKAKADSLTVQLSKEKTAQDSLMNTKQNKNLSKEIVKTSIKDSIEQAKKEELANQIQRSDSSYKAWVKKTVQLYEAMDSKKAAKIILTYSDNIAKDILYTMKKKKAAGILSQLTPETVSRITRIK